MAIESLKQLRNKLSGLPDDYEGNSYSDELSKIPGYAENAALALPGKLIDLAGQVPDAAKKVLTHPINSLQDFLGGVARGSQNLASALGESGQWIGDRATKNIYNRFTGKDLNIPKVDIRQEMGLGNNNPVDLGSMIQNHLGNNPNALISSAGQYGLGGAAGGARFLPMVAANAATGAIQSEPGQRVQGATEGAINSGLPMAAGKAIGKGYNALKPSNLFQGTLSPEELQSNLKAAEGTNTGLGDVIGSPTLKRLQENILPHIPLSGAYTKMQETANQITEKGQDLMSKIGEKLPEGDKGFYLKQALDDAYQEAYKEKEAKFKVVNDEAKNEGVTTDRSNLYQKARNHLNRIESDPDLKNFVNSGTVSLLNRIVNNSDITFPANPKRSFINKEPGYEYTDPATGERKMGVAPEYQYSTPARNSASTSAPASPITGEIPKKEFSLQSTDYLRGHLGESAHDAWSDNNQYLSNIFKDLKKASEKDINDAIDKSGSKSLSKSRDEAMEYYRTKFSQFDDPDIQKFIRKGGDTDLILSHFLKGGANDRGNLLQKLTTKLPEDQKELPLHMYLSKAIDESGQLNPPKLRTLYKNLGKKQLDALVPDSDMRAQLEKYVRSVGLNSDAFNTMFNPKTGQRNLDSAIGAIEGMMAYNNPLKAAGGMILGRGATKALTSEKLRTALVNAIIKSKSRNP